MNAFDLRSALPLDRRTTTIVSIASQRRVVPDGSSEKGRLPAMDVVCFCDCEFHIEGAVGVCPQCGEVIRFAPASADEAESPAVVEARVDSDVATRLEMLELLARSCHELAMDGLAVEMTAVDGRRSDLTAAPGAIGARAGA